MEVVVFRQEVYYFTFTTLLFNKYPPAKPGDIYCLRDYGEVLIAEHFVEINVKGYEGIEKIWITCRHSSFT